MAKPEQAHDTFSVAWSFRASCRDKTNYPGQWRVSLIKRSGFSQGYFENNSGRDSLYPVPSGSHLTATLQVYEDVISFSANCFISNLSWSPTFKVTVSEVDLVNMEYTETYYIDNVEFFSKTWSIPSEANYLKIAPPGDYEISCNKTSSVAYDCQYDSDPLGYDDYGSTAIINMIFASFRKATNSYEEIWKNSRIINNDDPSELYASYEWEENCEFGFEDDVTTLSNFSDPTYTPAT